MIECNDCRQECEKTELTEDECCPCCGSSDVETIPELCPDCWGSGISPSGRIDHPCGRCKGEGVA